jgi:hypothetical protein
VGHANFCGRFFVALAGAIISSQLSLGPAQQQTAEKDQKGQSNEKSNVTLWDRWFPDSISVYTLFLMIFTGLLAVAGVYQLNFLSRAEGIAAATSEAAKDSADLAKDTLIASNRPWLYVDAKIKGIIDFTREPITVPIEYVVTNSGHSPALSVWITAEFLVHNLGRAAWDIQRDYCDGIRKTFTERSVGDPKKARLVVFPDHPYLETAYYQIDQDQLKAAVKITGNYAQSLLIGCVNYRTSVDSDAHQTRFIFEFRRPDGVNAVMWAAPKSATDEISLGRYFIGDVAD